MADTSKKKKLKIIAKILDDHCGIRSMDNNDPEAWAVELQAVLDETYCLECGGYPGCTFAWSLPHFSGCSSLVA